MRISTFAQRSCFALALGLALPAFAQKNVLQPGDPLVASSSNSPGTEGVGNAIDGKTTKYLNFDQTIALGRTSGFIVSPSVGVTRVIGMRVQSANDGPERDPKTITLEGSNDATVTAFNAGNWEAISTVDLPDFTARFQTQTATFANLKPYKHYRWTVTAVRTPNTCCMQVAEVELLGSTLSPDVTQPGDPLIASSSNSPGTEGVGNVIDNKTTKYLNFDQTIALGRTSGFIVSPSVGKTLLNGITVQSANDGPERDPKSILLEGSNDDTVTAFNAGNWTAIQTVDLPDFATRFQTQTVLFDNYVPYKHYRLTVLTVRTPNTCCMQVAEIELLGTGAPKDITQAGDPLIASSSNSPGTEGVGNVIDNKTTKYLNFDQTIALGRTSGFVVTPSAGPSQVIGMTVQSANDGPERDPKTITLEGSNDDTITAFNSGAWEAIATVNLPDFTTRFQTQEAFFANNKIFKHYRWTVTAVRTPNTCCMQVAEVELLALVQGADCTKAAFTSQPVNQPVLAGSSAEFLATVNGPWPLQWLKNGLPIPGATANKLVTAPITAENASDVYALQIVGCEKSADVQAVIFTPSTTKSIGINFAGWGANGAPTVSRVDDIAGIHLQAHWNNSPDPVSNTGSSTLPNPNLDPINPILDSDGNPVEMTFNYTTGGAWGSGTADATATDRLLNGIIGNGAIGTAGTFTYQDLPGGTHSLIVYSVSPPLQFQTLKYTVGEVSYYMRAMNSDEYNAAPGFYRGSSTDPNAPTVGNFVRFDNLVVEPFSTLTLTVQVVGPAYERPSGVNALQVVLNSGPAGVPPVIAVNPQPVVAELGKTARLSVDATGEGLTFQWRKNGRNISNGGNISGATTAELAISDFSAADAGVYSVSVFNSAGSVISKNATASVSAYLIADQLVGYWKYDETAGTTVANSATGAAANTIGTITGTPSWVAGQVGNAGGFDGATYVHVPNYPKARAAISGAAWVKVDALNAANIILFRNAQGDMTVSGGAGRIVGQFEVGLNFDSATGMLAPTATVGIGPNIARTTGAPTVTQDAWHHIAFSADGAQLRVYADGQEVAVVDYLAEINAPDIDYISMGAQLNMVDPGDGNPSALGPDPINPRFLVGLLDEVALWTRALTAQEVSLLYQAGVAKNALTTVVIPKPASDPKLTISRVGNSITVTFDAGILQSSPTIGVGANWQPVPNSSQSPHSHQLGNGNVFFRAVIPQ